MDSAVKDKFAGKSVSTIAFLLGQRFLYFNPGREFLDENTRQPACRFKVLWRQTAIIRTHFDIRRARFDFQGMWYKIYFF